MVCVALGIDMFDCVFPTRTARFGCALLHSGQINLKNKKYEKDFRPIDENCSCSTCQTYTRAYLHHIVTFESVSSSLISIHNVAYQLRLMREMREAISNNTFPDYVRGFFKILYPEDIVPPGWVCDALKAVGIEITNGNEENKS